MKNNFCNLFFGICISCSVFECVGSNRNYVSEREKVQPGYDYNSAGIRFTPNKGQLSDMEGKLCPDVLYKGEGSGADIYLRKTGISYVYSNLDKVLHAVDEEVEELIKTGIIGEAEESKKMDELMQKESVSNRIKLHRVDMDFANCNRNCSTINEHELDGYNNYYYAHCPNGVLNVKQYNKVTYKNIYNNIDVSYYGDKKGGIKYDIIVHPHADPSQIELHWKGAESISLNHEGNLVIKTSLNEFYETIPKVYQNVNGNIVDVKARYNLALSSSGRAGEGLVHFELGTWDPELPLIIDPWATYYGGNDDERSTGIATDKSGNVVVTGRARSLNFPRLSLAGSYTQGYGGNSFDAFVLKFNAAGTRLWATFYGGATYEGGESIATDNAGNIVFTGRVESTNFPIGQIGANVVFQSVYTGVGSSEAFVVKFDPAGVRLWATYYGGSSLDIGQGITVDNLDNVVITGQTNSTDFPTGKVGVNLVFQSVFGGATDAFVAKFSSTGARLWGTLYGGIDTEYGNSIITDNTGNVAIVGYSSGTNFPVFAGSGYTQSPGGGGDAFIVKFDNLGTRLWATYYGGSGSDIGQSVVVDNMNNFVAAGRTGSADLPTGQIAANVVFQSVMGGSADAFLVKFNNAGTRLWATFYGGAQYEDYQHITIDAKDNVYLYMESEDAASPSIIDACSYQPVFNGGSPVNVPGNHPTVVEDQTIVKFAADGNKICATYFGGTGEDDLDSGGGIASFGNSLYITGMTDGGYPVTPGAFQTAFAGYPWDVFVASLCSNICEGKILGLNYSTNTSICTNKPVKFTPSIANSCDTAGYKFHWTFTGGTPAVSDSVNPTVLFSGMGSYNVKLVLTTICKKDSVIKSLIVTPCIINASITSSTICSGGCTSITASGSNGTGPYTYSWNTGAGTPSINVCPTSTQDYTVMITDALGNNVAATTTVLVQSTLVLTSSSVNISCTTQGSASVTVAVGVWPYSYSWSNGQTGSAVSGLGAGGYTVTVTNGNGCTQTKTFNISGTSPVSADFTFPMACIGTPVNFTNTGSTGTYIWTIGGVANLSGTTANFSYTFLTAGAYSISHTVTNAGCSATITKVITVANCNSPTVTATGNSACPGSCATVSSTASGGTNPYTYSWSNGATTQNINPCPVTTTTYTVTIRDSGGNTSTSTAVVTIYPLISVTATSSNISCSGASTGSASAAVGGGTAPYLYAWGSGQTSQTVTGLSAGNYAVTITDSKGCTSVSAATIISPAPIVGQFNKGTANCAGCGCKEWIMVNASGGTSPYSYAWPDGYVSRYKNQLCPGNYTIIIKDKNGCSVNVNLTAP